SCDQRLVFAAGNHDAPGFDAALRDGASVDARDAHQMTALMWAAGAGDVATARRLIDRGADVNATDRLGSTPLMCAAQFNQVEVMRLLLARGADPGRTDNYHRTAQDRAMTSEASDAIMLLQTHREGEAPAGPRLPES